MKKSSKIFGILLAGTLVIALTFTSYAGWDYRSVESFDRMDGRTYLVTHCQDQIGDDCTTPGSATRLDISIVVETLQSVGWIKGVK